MQKCYVITVDPSTAAPRPFCSVKVLIAGGSTLADLFADNETTPLVNPLTSDGAGRTFFKTLDGDYDIEISGSGFTAYKYTGIQVADKDNFAPKAGPPPITPDVIPTGVVMAFAAAAAPSGWRICDGAAISRAAFAALFTVIGTTYGVGDGSTTFNLPDLRGRALTGLDSGQTEFTPLGKTGGAKTHTLSTTEMPVHAHTVNFSDPGHGHQMLGAQNAAGTGPTGRMAPGVNAAANDTGAVIANTTGITVSLNNAGSGGSHNNLQPYLTMNYIIKT